MCQLRSSDVVELPPDVCTFKEARSVSVDRCIVAAMKALWAAKIETLGCCCGHGTEPPSVIIANGYTESDARRAAEALRAVDSRSWNIMQWQRTTVLTT